MSDHSSSSSLPTSPVTTLPELPYFKQQARRTGPGSVFSETTEGYGDYTTNLPFTFSSASLALAAVPQEWSSAKHGFHAISTVVNSPHKRSAPPKAHSAVPSVAPTVLPRLNRKVLDQHIQGIAPEWETFQRSRQLGLEGVAHVEDPSTPSMDLPQTPRQLPSKQLPSLDTIPSVFFDPLFDLGDYRTFNAVIDQEDDSEPPDPVALSYSLPLIEKLSHYADTIEQHLVREISLRSTSFFAALSNLQDLQTESEQCIDRISRLRTMLKEVDDKNAKKGLEIIRMENKLWNLETVKDGVRIIADVVEMTVVARGLVAAGQWGEALGVVEELQELLDEEQAEAANSHKPLHPKCEPSDGHLSPVQESPRIEQVKDVSSSTSKRQNHVALSKLHAFSSLPTHLRSLTMDIASSLSNELVNILRIDLMEHVTGSPRHEHFSQTLKDRLRPLLQGLMRTGGLREATLTWREVVLEEVRNCVNLHLPMFNKEEGEKKSPLDPGEGDSLSNHLHSLSHADFMTLIRAIYKSFLNCVEGVQAQNTVFVEVLEAIQTAEYTVDTKALKEELSDILSSAAELSNARASTVVSLRSEEHVALSLPDFLDLFNDSWNFVLKCEVICRRMIVGLRGVIVTQAKAFLQAFHQDHISQSAKLVEDEQWSQADVPPPMQRIVQMIIDSAVHDPPELLVGHTPAPVSPLTNGKTPSSPSRISKHVKIEDRSYFAVSATLETLHLLVDYLRMVSNLSMLTTDTMSRVVEFLKSFNSRTCQVVLGAGAMRSAGLKNITAKHLALASQSLSIMITLIPYVRETFRRHLSEKQAVMLVEFDKLKRDYQEHQNEIHAKLIAIMGDRLTAHIRSLQAVQWAVPSEKQGVNDYMELLVKETVTLHKVLSRYLPISVVEYVMSQVFAAINHDLTVEYAAIILPDQLAKERLAADVKFMYDKFSALKNVGGTSTGMLMTVVSEKSTVSQPPRTNTTDRIKGMLSRHSSTHADPTRFPNSSMPTQSPTQSASDATLPTDQESLSLPEQENGFHNGLQKLENGHGVVPPAFTLDAQQSSEMDLNNVNTDS